MQGAHRGVWCSKGTLLIEAELFAAESKRPAQNGRALLCAANYAREIQGITASHKLTDARNRASVTPVSLHISDVSAQRKVRGVKRGQETIRCPVPLCLLRQTAAIVHAHLERKVAYSGEPLYRRKVYRLPTVKKQGAPLGFLQKIICKALTTSDVRIIM